MSKVLLTGGTGFIGSHLARALAARGDELRLLVRRQSSASGLNGIEFERVTGDITDRRAVRRALEGVERVFHVAGSTSMRRQDIHKVFEVNLAGTRILCEEALAAGVERLIHTSSAAAVGTAKPNGRVDETHQYTAARHGIAYANSKHEAEAEVLRAAAQGLNASIVNPTFVLGPDTPSRSSMDLIRRFLLRQIPMYVDGGLNIVDVRDIAAGHLLADAHGLPGERYILGGRNFTLQRLFADLSRISGVAPPPVRMPPAVAVGAARFAEQFGLPLPVSGDEAHSASMWWTYSSAKAKRELGFTPRAHEDTLRAAIEWMRDDLGDEIYREAGLPVAALDAAARAGRILSRLSPV